MEREPLDYGKRKFAESLRVCQDKEGVKECAQVMAEKDCNVKFEDNRIARMTCRAGTQIAKEEE